MKKGTPITKRTLLMNLRSMQNKAAFELRLNPGESIPHDYWGGYWQAAKESLELAERLILTWKPKKVKEVEK